uniref:RRM domain-containing protein n=1 Tax=Davidia involucrata TaxID=16924 RepID=A0A5B7B925_DAVIN
MATSCLAMASSSSLVCKSRTILIESSSSLPCSIHFRYPKLSCYTALSMSLSHPADAEPFVAVASSLLWPTSTSNTRLPTALALLQEQPFAAATTPEEETNFDDIVEDENLITPCELYVCNLPRSCGIAELLDIFKPYGTVQSVEVSRNAETGISRGCGYVTMSSMDEAKAAIAALDGSDVGGREMRVRFSVDVNTERNNLEALNSAPKKNLIFESPYKVYAGNLAWSVRPEDLRNLFSQFGTVVSARVLHDRKGGKNRVYGFLSFSAAAESEAAISLNRTEFCGRTLLVREVLNKTES